MTIAKTAPKKPAKAKANGQKATLYYSYTANEEVKVTLANGVTIAQLAKRLNEAGGENPFIRSKVAEHIKDKDGKLLATLDNPPETRDDKSHYSTEPTN